MEIIREIKGEPLNGASSVYRYLEEFKNQDREHFIVIGLDTGNKPCYREIVSIGILNQTIVHPREIFKKAIIMSCNSIIIAHNHPGNSLKASAEDIIITIKLIEAGDLLGIKLLDHIIITKDGYKSIIEDL